MAFPVYRLRIKRWRAILTIPLAVVAPMKPAPWRLQIILRGTYIAGAANSEFVQAGAQGHILDHVLPSRPRRAKPWVPPGPSNTELGHTWRCNVMTMDMCSSLRGLSDPRLWMGWPWFHGSDETGFMQRLPPSPSWRPNQVPLLIWHG